jgi:PAS domain S-box-containing protein
MNKVAEKHTGWSESDAIGKNIGEVFQIFDEGIQKKIDLDIRKIIQEKEIVEFGNQSLLVSRNKGKIPVVYSGAPIKNKDGSLLGAVIVFYDRTEERLRQKLITTRLSLFEYGITHTIEDTLIKALDDICELTQSKFGFLHFLNDGQRPLLSNKWMSEGENGICDIQNKIFQQLTTNAEILTDCIKRNKPVIHNSNISLSNSKKNTKTYPIFERDIVVPLCENKKIVAILGVVNKPGLYTETDKEIVNFLADVAWVIAEEKKQEAKLKKSEEKYRNLFQNSVIQLVIESDKGYIVDANEAAAEFYDLTVDKLKQLKFTDINILHKEHFNEKLKGARKNENCYSVFKHQKRDGTIAYIESVSSKINIDGKELLHSIIHDITEKIVAEKELVLAKEKAEESNRLKSAFLATISHELRTPLNSIIGFSEIMSVTTKEKNTADFSKVIQKSGENLLTVIDDIFDLALVENNKIRVRPVEFTLYSLLINLKKSTKDFLKRAEKINSIRLGCNTGLDLNNRVYADKRKIIQVMVNLIRNAVKYTEEGIIELGMNINSDNYISIYIKDTGIGIPEDKQKIIFDFFRQGEDSLTRKYGGIGVGLAISNRIAIALGGEISVNSVLGKGSVFTFSFPARILKSLHQFPDNNHN